jgi:hypothetical protein
MTGGRRLSCPTAKEDTCPLRPSPAPSTIGSRSHSPGGGPPRCGLILEILGAQGHEHYRVRRIDDHESIYYPPDGAVIVPPDHDVARF